MSDEKNTCEPSGSESDDVEPTVVIASSSTWLLPMLALLIAESFFLMMMNIQGVSIHVPVIPIEFGLIKDLADLIIVVLFPWHGWVFAILLLVCFFSDFKAKYSVVIYLLSTISTAIISSVFNYNELSLMKISVGVLTYSAINLSVFLFFFLCKFAINGALTCRR